MKTNVYLCKSNLIVIENLSGSLLSFMEANLPCDSRSLKETYALLPFWFRSS